MNWRQGDVYLTDNPAIEVMIENTEDLPMRVSWMQGEVVKYDLISPLGDNLDLVQSNFTKLMKLKRRSAY